jgi:2-dehydropantoate 2-reductase
LIEAFGSDKVIGGLCFIESTLNHEGEVVQTSPGHMLMFGERNGEQTERIRRLEETFSGTKAKFRYRQNIIQEMWHKYLFITAMSGITTLLQSPMGPIREEQSGAETLKKLVVEIGAVMNRIEAPISENAVEDQLEKLNSVGFDMKSSMQRDMEKGLPVEAEHLQGYILKLAIENSIPVPVLEAVYANLKIYEGKLKI